jgi:hypothetical protein
MPIRHKHVLASVDPADASLVGASKWNDDHTLPEIGDVNGLQAALDAKADAGQGGAGINFREFLLMPATVVFTNLPVAFTEASGQQSRNHLDLTGFTQFKVQFVMSVAAVAGDVKLQYATAPNFASPVDLIQNDNPGANALIESAWTPLPAGARGDVYVRVGMLNGNTTEDPGIRWYRFQVK